MKLIKIHLILLFLIPSILKAQEPVVIEHSLELFKKEYPEGFENLYVPALRYAGDIDGDGLADFRLSSSFLDLDTDNLYDYKFEYKIYYGSTEPIVDYDTEISFDIENISSLPGYTPVGDLNGDGCDDHETLSNLIFFDFSCGAFTDTLSFDPRINFYNKDYTIEVDIDGDGFEDILFHHSNEGYDRTLQFGILFGAAIVDSIKYKEYELIFELTENDIEGERLYREGALTAGDIDNDGDIELLVFGYNKSSENEFTAYNPGDFLILEQNDSTGFEVALAYNMPYQYDLGYQPLQEDSDIYFGEYKAGGFKEVFITDGLETHILIEVGTKEEEIQVIEYVDINKKMQKLSFMYPIGDFDQDGVLDLYTTPLNENTHKILFSGSELGVFTETEFSLENRFISINNWNRDYLENTANGYLGDINSDGYHDFLMYSVELSEGEDSPGIDNVLGEGVVFQFGNSGRDVTQRHELFHPAPATQEALSTFNAGDFNDDGVEDYGVLFKNSLTSEKSSRIELFFGEEGKSNWESPDLIFESEQGFQPSYPATGDFNGDGISDIVINYQHQDGGIHFYWGGGSPDNTVDKTIEVRNVVDFTEFEPGFYGFSILENIQDINGDQIDDLAFSTSLYRQNGNEVLGTYILYSGEISDQHNDKIDLYIETIQGLGDIDQDGKNEFLTSNNNSVVTIYEGFNESEGESFSHTPEYNLEEFIFSFDNQDVKVLQFGYSSTIGDFNGDGITDLAVSGTSYIGDERLNSRVYQYEGGPLIYIYYGGEDFDALYDQSLKIPISNLRSLNGTALSEVETNYVNYWIGELTTIPDYEGNSRNGLLIGTSTNSYLTNALIFSGEADSLALDLVVKGENQNLGLGSQDEVVFSNRIYSNSRSAIGDFNLDGKLDFLLPQSGDPNFPVDPVYVFSLGTIETSIEEEKYGPIEFSLSQNYPNPFNPSTQITYNIPASGEVTLQVFDTTGRLVTTLVNEKKRAGTYEINFDASQLSSGVYIYRLTSTGHTQTQKMTLIK